MIQKVGSVCRGGSGTRSASPGGQGQIHPGPGSQQVPDRCG